MNLPLQLRPLFALFAFFAANPQPLAATTAPSDFVARYAAAPLPGSPLPKDTFPLLTARLLSATDPAATVTALLRDAANLPFGVAAITPWEIAMLTTRGRLLLSRPVADWLAQALRPEFVAVLPLVPAIAVDSCTLPGQFHADPADRLIVATARHHGLTLLTADSSMRAYPHLRTLWD